MFSFLGKTSIANKFIGSLIAGGVGWATMVVASKSGPITAPEWVAGGTYLAISVQTYLLGNAPSTANPPLPNVPTLPPSGVPLTEV
jgi:hypothetical protein